ncbi:hypothetical protein C1634_015980 [Chryseobacterium viscerum]|uniref:Uncharacterized protein n=2 Tax=Chryseobacterium TaxID=59732 RepID=A0A1H6I2V7_CHRCI|nr:hypothetical protein C1634_015980 [Chryseobacterium viscerum]SEH40971.1 hypothetical protein SAMN05421593_3866 [Chryseobacterium culicis]
MKFDNNQLLTLDDLEDILKKGRTMLYQYKKINKLTSSDMCPLFTKGDILNFFVQIVLKTNPNEKEH